MKSDWKYFRWNYLNDFTYRTQEQKKCPRHKRPKMFHLGWNRKWNQSIDICQRGNFSTCGSITRNIIEFDQFVHDQVKHTRMLFQRFPGLRSFNYIILRRVAQQSSFSLKNEINNFFQNFGGKERTKNFYIFFLFFFFHDKSKNSGGRNYYDRSHR